MNLALLTRKNYKVALTNGYEIDGDDNLQCRPSWIVFGTMAEVQIL